MFSFFSTKAFSRSEEEVVVNAMQILSSKFEKISEEQTKKMHLDTVERNAMALKDVPQKYQTLEMCIDAIQRNRHAVQCIKSPEMRLIMASKFNNILEHLLFEQKTPEIYQACVTRDWKSLGWVPIEEITYKLAYIAALQDRLALEFKFPEPDMRSRLEKVLPT